VPLLVIVARSAVALRMGLLAMLELVDRPATVEVTVAVPTGPSVTSPVWDSITLYKEREWQKQTAKHKYDQVGSLRVVFGATRSSA